MRISNWSSDLCSSDPTFEQGHREIPCLHGGTQRGRRLGLGGIELAARSLPVGRRRCTKRRHRSGRQRAEFDQLADDGGRRSEEHTSELQSLIRISYAVFCLQKKNTTHHYTRRS